MSKFTLTLLDTTGIQDYIFASNRLQENIGASELVYRATSLWAFDELEKLKLSHNIKNPYSLDWLYTSDQIEENPALQAEVLQAAAGNAIIIFREQSSAKAFVKKLSLRLLQEAPGLKVLAQHIDFDFYQESLTDQYDDKGCVTEQGKRSKLEGKANKHKLSRLESAPALGLGVTAMCASTGLAAVNTLGGSLLVEGKVEPIGLDGEDLAVLVSSETAAKRVWRGQANRRLRYWLHQAADGYEFPYELEKIGRILGEESYISVVHVDGNKMGARFKYLAQKIEKEYAGKSVRELNRGYIEAAREMSQQANQISRAALETVVALTVQAVKNAAIPFTTDDQDTPILPLRPLVFGGDDVTFICNGDVGVELAAAYLDTFEREAQKYGQNFHACAGVATVKLHYPFARAYKLSEDLLGNAKKLVRKLYPDPKEPECSLEEPQDCSALDWHFAQSGLSGSIDSIRKREYTVPAGQLELRPLTLEGWRKLEGVMEAFNGSYWGEKHNKVIGLREALRGGPEAVAKYRRDFDLRELPEFAGDEARKTGWQGNICQYFDAIEMLDHHVSLKNKEGQK